MDHVAVRRGYSTLLSQLFNRTVQARNQHTNRIEHNIVLSQNHGANAKSELYTPRPVHGAPSPKKEKESFVARDTSENLHRL